MTGLGAEPGARATPIRDAPRTIHMSEPTLDPTTLARLRTAIATELERAQRRLASLDREFQAIVAAGEQGNTDDEHDPEGATLGFERAQVAALREDARERIVDLLAALERMETGDYGRCSSCGAMIATERLVARPATRRCRACAD